MESQVNMIKLTAYTYSLHDSWGQEQSLPTLIIIPYHRVSLGYHKVKQNLSVIDQY